MTAKAGSVVRGTGGTCQKLSGGASAPRRRLRLAAAALLFTGAASQAGCGSSSTINVTVVTPSGSADPFLNATTVRMTLSNSPGSAPATAAVTGGKFQVNLQLDTPMDGSFLQLLVEALDGSGVTVARGTTPNFDPQNTDVSVYVNRPGQVGSTDLHLPDDMVTPGSARARHDLMGTSLIGRQVMPAEPAIGALIVGGAGDDGSLVNEAVMYKTLGHQLIDAGSPISAGDPSVARRGGIMVASADADAGQQAVLWGGSVAGGTLPTFADKFDPGVSTLAMVWAHPEAPYFDAGGPGAYQPSVGQVGSEFLACGGSGMGPPVTVDMPLTQAVLFLRNPAPTDSADQTARLGVTRVPPAMGSAGPMVAPRYQHTVIATADGGSGFVFGGLSAADSAAGKPSGELFAVATNSFSAFPFKPMAPPSRRGHVAARLTTGQILIIGGYTFDSMGKKAFDGSALLIDPIGGAVQTLTPFLKTPRYAASITTAGKELVICGGFDATDRALADCEVFAADTAMPAARSPIMLPGARAGHLALTLENGLTLLVGGVDQNNSALSTIDIYTSAN